MMASLKVEERPPVRSSGGFFFNAGQKLCGSSDFNPSTLLVVLKLGLIELTYQSQLAISWGPASMSGPKHRSDPWKPVLERPRDHACGRHFRNGRDNHLASCA